MFQVKMEKESGLKIVARYLGLSDPRLAFLLPLAFLVLGAWLAFFLPRLDRFVPGGAPVTQIFLEGIWFALMYHGVLSRRKSYREKYGERAYQKIVLHYFLFTGTLMFAGILRPIWVEGHLISLVSTSFRILIGFYFLVAGILLEMKGVRSLGIDRVVFIYTVFPECGTHVQSALYQFLRHPLYSAMAHMALGVAFLAGQGEGVWCAVIFVLKLFLWSKVEERELIGRFGEGYREYHKKTPAFFPKFFRLKDFWREVLS